MQIVKAYVSPDGDRKLEISRRTDGMFSFEELAVDVYIEPDDEYLPDGETYWVTTDLSGLHQSLEAAEAEAMARLPWLRNGNYLPAPVESSGL
jgi:hypothetical protein